MTDVDAEFIVVDTGLFSLLGQRRRKPERFVGWDAAGAERLDAAIMVVSFVTVAEVESGLMAAESLTFARRERQRLSALPVLPLDQPTLDAWAGLDHTLRSAGKTVGDNDIWIAAAAKSRGLALSTTDRGLTALSGELEVMYFPSKPDSGPPLRAV